LASLLALRRLGREEVAVYLEDRDPAIVFEAARAINDAPVAAASAKLAAMLEKKLPDKAWSRAVNAAYRSGESSLLANFARRKDVPEAAIVEAVRALADWGNPSGRDRILHV